MNVNRNVIYRGRGTPGGSVDPVDDSPGPNINEDIQMPNVFEPIVLIDDQVSRDRDDSADGYGNRRRKKAHKVYSMEWAKSIKENGYAKCVMATCDFTSKTLQGMQSHYKVCREYPTFNLNFCVHCKQYLSSPEELSNHKNVCGKGKETTGDTFAKDMEDQNKREEMWEDQINMSGKATCGYNYCGFEGTKLSDLVEHFKFCSRGSGDRTFICPSCGDIFEDEEEFFPHKETCFRNEEVKKNNNVHLRKIKQLFKNKTDKDCIIQPGPPLDGDQYLRRRPYTKQHKITWANSVAKHKYVKCMYQNCYFVAMSVEDMIYHFGYCNGDGSFAKFVCPHCKGRVTSEEILQMHIERSHFSESKNEVPDDKECDDLGKRKIQDLTLHEDQSTSSGELLSSLRRWQDQINQSGYAFCPRDKCNFLSSKAKDLEVHLKTCKAAADSDLYRCCKCGDKIKTRENWDIHESNCSGVAKVLNSEAEEGLRFLNVKETGKNLKGYTTPHQVASELDTSQTPDVKETPSPVTPRSSYFTPQPKKRGRKPKNWHLQSPENQQLNESSQSVVDLDQLVKCGKCGFEGTFKNFNDHNLRRHVGLGWIEGEQPVDLSDEKEVLRLVKMAFKQIKSATCEVCHDVKRSFLGFVTHIQNCGKTAEEKAALKVQCPYCPGKYLKYSLPVHIKISHSASEDGSREVTSEVLDSGGKRRSALRAVSKFQEVLTENEEEDKSRDDDYFSFQKGSLPHPKLSTKLNNLWYRLQREKKKIPCKHANCPHLSDEVRNAKYHHFTCAQLPERVYMCKLCDFYSVTESQTRSHVQTHPRVIRLKKAVQEAAKSDLEDEINENEGKNHKHRKASAKPRNDVIGHIVYDDSKKGSNKRKSKKPVEDESKQKKAKLNQSEEFGDLEGGDELILKRNFCRKENIDNVRGVNFYRFGLDMSLEEERAEEKCIESWSEFHTQLKDWNLVSEEVAKCILPQGDESMSVAFTDDTHKDISWRRFKRFEGDIVQGVPVMFTGGSVRAMSWNKISLWRMMSKTARQYLAVSSADTVENIKDMKDRSNMSKMSLLQIWDCGVLDNAPAVEAPKLSLGIIHEGGEVWDLSWFPEDTATEGSDDTLRRIGLMVTASDDGVVRVWSICDSSQLPTTKGLPIYKTEPIAKLVVDEDLNDSCFRVSVGRNGVIAGGYANGVLAVWNLKNFSSPFCKKQKDCYVINAHLVIQAHRTSITALTFSTGSSRYVSTGGLDRIMKVWDLQFPSVPIEQFTKELCLDNVWTKNWPAIVYNFDEVLVNNNTGVVRFIKDILMDKHQSCVILENVCLSLSFCDWLNALCACNNNGEVKVRLLKNLIQNQKINEQTQCTISSLHLEKLNGENKEKESCDDKSKSKPECSILRSFKDICSEFGIVIRDNVAKDKPKVKKVQIHHEEFPIKAVNKVCFNPNFKSFTHIAVGYNIGLIRIQYLKEMQSNKHLNSFLENVEREML